MTELVFVDWDHRPAVLVGDKAFAVLRPGAAWVPVDPKASLRLLLTSFGAGDPHFVRVTPYSSMVKSTTLPCGSGCERTLCPSRQSAPR